jgi:hypothetical protein
MFRKILFAGAAIACGVIALTGCSKANKAQPTQPTPPERTVVFTEGFEGDLSKWDAHYLIQYPDDIYSLMRITGSAANTGTHSLTSDSNRTALYIGKDHHLDTARLETGTVGLEFYIMAKAAGQANFTVDFGQDAGSSGGMSGHFGIGFDPSDSLVCTYYDMYDYSSRMDNGYWNKLIAPIELNRWYKCNVEANFTDSTLTYKIDDSLVRADTLPVAHLMGIDGLLVFRGYGYFGMRYAPSTEGPQQYYVDDIVVYKK